MCSREEVKAEVEAVERRMNDALEKSHTSIAHTISNVGGDVRILKDNIQKHLIEQDRINARMADHIATSSSISKLTPEHVDFLISTVESVRGMDSVRRFFLGASAFFIAIGTLVYGFIHLIKAIR